MVASYIFRHFLCILKVNGIRVHSDGKGLYGLTKLLCGNRANQGGVKTS